MALNFPGPYGIEFSYTVDSLTHRQNVNCSLTTTPDPGISFSDVDVVLKGGGSQQLDEAVDDYIDLVAAIYTTTAEWVNAQLWEYSPLSFERRWIASYTIGVNGDVGSAYTPASEYIITYRTAEGGTMQLRYEEVSISSFAKVAVPTGSGAVAALANYVIGDSTGWLLARDTSYPVAGLWILPGQNEAIFKKRYRS